MWPWDLDPVTLWPLVGLGGVVWEPEGLPAWYMANTPSAVQCKVESEVRYVLLLLHSEGHLVSSSFTSCLGLV